MYWIEDGNGRRQPRATAPQVRITNLQEVFGMLDAGTDPCVAHAEYANGDTMDVEIPSNYARNSIGRKTRIRGNELFIKRLNVDLSYLARYEWGRTHQWDENELGSWTDAIGVPFDETLADRDIATRLQPVFPKSDIAGWLDLYSIRRGWAPVPSTSELIRALLHERENAPLRQHRPANSGIAYETFDSGYGEMGVARDKRTGQTWMWPMDETDTCGAGSLGGTRTIEWTGMKSGWPWTRSCGEADCRSNSTTRATHPTASPSGAAGTYRAVRTMRRTRS